MSFNIKKIEHNGKEYPTDYVIRKVNEHVLVSLNQVDTTNEEALRKIAKNPSNNAFFAKILNVGEMIKFARYVASGDIPTAGAGLSTDLSSKETPDWKEWLKASEDVLYDTLIGFRSDFFASWQVSLPSASQRGGILSSDDTDRVYTEDDLVHLKSTSDHWPSFRIFGASQGTLGLAHAHIKIGYKYGYTVVNYVPVNFEPVVLKDVGE